MQLIWERGAKMGGYIKRDTAIRAVMAAKWVDGSDGAMAMEIVASPPAADVAPVVHGEWVRPHWRNSNFCYDCSVCGNEVMHQEYRWRDKKIYPICPWCGAKMDGGADNG